MCGAASVTTSRRVVFLLEAEEQHNFERRYRGYPAIGTGLTTRSVVHARTGQTGADTPVFGLACPLVVSATNRTGFAMKCIVVFVLAAACIAIPARQTKGGAPEPMTRQAAEAVGDGNAQPVPAPVRRTVPIDRDWNAPVEARESDIVYLVLTSSEYVALQYGKIIEYVKHSTGAGGEEGRRAFFKYHDPPAAPLPSKPGTYVQQYRSDSLPPRPLQDLNIVVGKTMCTLRYARLHPPERDADWEFRKGYYLDCAKASAQDEQSPGESAKKVQEAQKIGQAESALTREKALEMIDAHIQALANPAEMPLWTGLRGIISKLDDESWLKALDSAVKDIGK